MRPTLCAVHLVHPLWFLLGTVLIGCAASQPPPAPTTTDTPAGLGSASGAPQPADPAPQGPTVPDPVAELGRRIEQFAQTVQPGFAASPEPAAGVPQENLSDQLDPLHSAAEPGREVTSQVRPLDAAPAGSAPPPIATLEEPPAPTAVREEPPEPPAEAVHTVEPLRVRLEQRLQTEPGALANIFDYQLLGLIESESADGAMQAGSPRLAVDQTQPLADLASLSLHAEDEVILRTVAEGLAGFREALTAITPRNRPQPSEKIASLLEMTRKLQRQVGLELPAIVLCDDVRAFGVYQPLPTEFALGAARQVVLYVEVDQFASERQAEGMWETRLSLEAVLYGPEGDPVLQVPTAKAIDRSHQRRRDFFICQVMTLPAIKKAGRYTLKVTVQDMLSNRIAQQSLPLAFGGETTK